MSDRIGDAVNKFALRHVEVLYRTPLFAPALEALIDTNMVLAGQRRIQRQLLAGVSGRPTARERRVAREQADRMELDPQRASMPQRPRVWWHEGGHGPTLVLLNGLTASGLMWPRGFVGRLEASHRVIRIDNRGTGYSRTAPAPYTIRTLANDVADVVRATEGAPAVVVGLSMGGMIAQEFAIRHPRLVRHLVLVATRPPGPGNVLPAASVRSRVLRPAPTGGTVDEVVAGMLTGFCGPGFGDVNADLVAELVAQTLRRVTPKVAANTQMRAIAAWHGPERLRALRVPTVVVHGEKDRLLPAGNGMRLARLIPSASYVELPGVGHIVPMEAGDALAAIIDGLH